MTPPPAAHSGRTTADAVPSRGGGRVRERRARPALPVDVRVGDATDALRVEAVLDALPSPTVLLAPDGTVLLTNSVWHEVADFLDDDRFQVGVGDDYFALRPPRQGRRHHQRDDRRGRRPLPGRDAAGLGRLRAAERRRRPLVPRAGLAGGPGRPRRHHPHRRHRPRRGRAGRRSSGPTTTRSPSCPTARDCTSSSTPNCGGPGAPAVDRALPRRRRVQGGQRHPRPRGRRRPPAPAVRAADRPHPRRRHRRPARRRRVRRPLPRLRRRRRRGTGPALPELLRPAVRPGRPRRAADREHRRRHGRRGRHRGALHRPGPGRRPGHVRGEGGRPQRRPLVHQRPAVRGPARACSPRPSCEEAIETGELRPALPAGPPPAHRRDRRRRGAGALAAPRPRPRPAAGVHRRSPSSTG